MATLFLLCGLPGTGKSTWARAAETRGAVRLSVDDVVHDRRVVRAADDIYGGDDFRATRHTIEAELLDHARRHLFAGVDVVYDEGLYTRARRDTARAVALDCGADVRLLHLTVDPEVQWQRIDARNRDPRNRQSVLTPGQLAVAVTWFEAPDNEGEIVVDTTQPEQLGSPVDTAKAKS